VIWTRSKSRGGVRALDLERASYGRSEIFRFRPAPSRRRTPERSGKIASTTRGRAAKIPLFDKKVFDGSLAQIFKARAILETRHAETSGHARNIR
jgi:hypothetical protein